VITPEQAASNGAALLDECDPGWWREDVGCAINLQTLDMSSGCRCVLGQRNFGSFLVGWEKLNIKMGDEDKYGFVVVSLLSFSDEDVYYRALTKAWRQEILMRRAAVSP